tara:strand:- start:7219 stop:9252 length:2034 start_codon:yes stop_codon:yes gene_type:complete
MLGADFSEKALDIDMGRNLDDKSASFNRGYHSKYHADTLKLMEEKAEQVNTKIVNKQAQAIITNQGEEVLRLDLGYDDAVKNIGVAVRNNVTIPNSAIGELQLTFLNQKLTEAKTLTNIEEQLKIIEGIELGLQTRRGDAEELPSLIKDINSSAKADVLLNKLKTFKNSIVDKDNSLFILNGALAGSDRMQTQLEYGISPGSQKDMDMQFAHQDILYNEFYNKYKEANSTINGEEQLSEEKLVEKATIASVRQMIYDMGQIGRPYLEMKTRFEFPVNALLSSGQSYLTEQNIETFRTRLYTYKTYKAQDIAIDTVMGDEQSAFYATLDALVNLGGDGQLGDVGTVLKGMLEKSAVTTAISTEEFEDMLSNLEGFGVDFRQPNLESQVEILANHFYKYTRNLDTVEDLVKEQLEAKYHIIDGTLVPKALVLTDEDADTFEENVKILKEQVSDNTGVDEDDLTVVHTGLTNEFIIIDSYSGLQPISKDNTVIKGKYTNGALIDPEFGNKYFNLPTEMDKAIQKAVKKAERDRLKKEKDAEFNKKVRTFNQKRADERNNFKTYMVDGDIDEKGNFVFAKKPPTGLFLGYGDAFVNLIKEKFFSGGSNETTTEKQMPPYGAGRTMTRGGEITHLRKFFDTQATNKLEEQIRKQNERKAKNYKSKPEEAKNPIQEQLELIDG